MLKALIKLGVLAVLPLIYLVLAESYNPLRFLGGWFQERFMHRVYLGTFEEIEAQILSVDENSRQQKVKEIASHFRAELKFSKIDDMVEGEYQRSRLRNGELVALLNEAESVAYRLSGTDWAIAVAAGETDSQDNYRWASGPFYLLQEAINEIPDGHLAAHLDSLEARFNWQIEILNEDQLNKLKREKGFHQYSDFSCVLGPESDGVRCILEASTGETLLVKPIFSRPLEAAAMIVPFILVLFCVCLGLALWLWPLWKDHKKLTTTAKNFGAGHLESRVKIRNGAFSAELAQSFNRMADNIQSLVNANQRLTNAVAHDLRTPMARLRFANEILESRECSDEEMQRYRNTINTSIDSLDYLIKQTLIHSRYNRSTDINHFAECDFAFEILEEVDQYRFESDDIEFKTNIDSSLLNSKQFVDSRALRRALGNLLNNAAKHAKSCVLVSYFQDDGRIGFKVEDDGSGIEEKDYEAIFEPYNQLGNSERNKAEGIGLGLSIVKQIAQWHRSEVLVEKSPLGGASFTLSWLVPD